MRMGVKGETVRLGIIGFGGRGMGQTETLLQMEDVQVAAVCDVYEDRVQKAQELVKRYRGAAPAGYSDW
ncbi:MAG: gfo/Idh/MocA family oxidoreductase, partial [Clostridia bacterium]|nr:gfo/Idh/MocA family oxidoreductase [Clostridia bacterium]